MELLVDCLPCMHEALYLVTSTNIKPDKPVIPMFGRWRQYYNFKVILAPQWIAWATRFPPKSKTKASLELVPFTLNLEFGLWIRDLHMQNI